MPDSSPHPDSHAGTEKAGTPAPLGQFRSIAVACAPDTGKAARLVDLAADLPVKVRDGDRWTAYDAPDVSLALASPTELPTGATVSLNVKVADARLALAALLSAGAERAGDLVEGSHELRAAVWLGPGIVLSVYEPR